MVILSNSFQGWDSFSKFNERSYSMAGFSRKYTKLKYFEVGGILLQTCKSNEFYVDLLDNF